MDVQVIASIIGIGGVTLSALFSGFGYFFKVRSEKLKTSRHVLYYLLEFRASIKAAAVSPSDLYDRYHEYCEEYFSRKAQEGINIPEEYKLMMLSNFDEVIESVRPKLTDDFISAYEQALKNLSKERPVLAFKLRGKEVDTRILSIQKQYLDQLSKTELFNSDSPISKFLKVQVRKMHEKGFKESLDMIDSGILSTAKHSGIFTYFQVKKAISSKQPPNYNFKELGVEDEIERMLSELPKYIAEEQRKVAEEAKAAG